VGSFACVLNQLPERLIKTGKFDSVSEQLRALIVICLLYWNKPVGNHNATIRLEVTYTAVEPVLLPYLPLTVWAPAASVSAQAVEELFEFWEMFRGEVLDFVLSLPST
jgi:hypothetical protein